MIRDGQYVAPDVIWTDLDGDRYAAHVICCGRDVVSAYIVIEFEDWHDGLRRVRVHPSQLEALR